MGEIGGRRVVASISGGKDSAAMSLHLRELGIEHDRVFMDTGWEHPETYDYLRGELTRVLGPIIEIRGDLLMPDLIRSKGTFPSRLRRYCTEELKVRPLQRYLKTLGGEVINAVGIRREESRARSQMLEWEWAGDFDCETWRPLIHWTEPEVIAIHHRHGLAPNPLYLKGASRVGCWPCIYARKSEIRMVADTDPGRIAELRAMEAELTCKSGATRAWFMTRDARKGPPMPIDKVVLWSRTAQGGRQFELFAPGPSEDGCMRWGLCDTPSEKG